MSFSGRKAIICCLSTPTSGFNAHDAIELLIWQIEKPEYRIIGAPYRLKTLEKVTWAFNYGKDFDPDATEPQEVRGTGTGFLLIHRTVFEELAAKFPEWKCKSDGLSGMPSNGSRVELMQFFQYGIDPETRLDLTEDYWFCERCREIGIKTWLCPWMKLCHVGMHIFE